MWDTNPSLLREILCGISPDCQSSHPGLNVVLLSFVVLAVQIVSRSFSDGNDSNVVVDLV